MVLRPQYIPDRFLPRRALAAAARPSNPGAPLHCLPHTPQTFMVRINLELPTSGFHLLSSMYARSLFFEKGSMVMLRPFTYDLHEAKLAKLSQLLSKPNWQLCKEAGLEFEPLEPTGIWSHPRRM
jgi:hypothetical protein